MPQTKKIHKEYVARINKVIDYVERNIDTPINLGQLADVANFSPFHFHRIFSALIGETVNEFVKRKRVEKAASILIKNPDEPISDIAFKCGYNSSSVFCRTFKEHFKSSAKQFREYKTEEISKIRKQHSKIDKLDDSIAPYLRNNINNEKWRLIMEQIQVKEMPSMDLIYYRHVGAFDKIGAAYENLFKWAGPRGLLKFPQTKTATIYHDDPSVTEIEKVRQSACITIDEDVKIEGEIGKMTVPSGKYAVGRFEISVDEFTHAWDTMCRWFSESGYQPDEGYPYELYHNDHTQHPENKFILDICIPAKPL